MKKLVLGAEDEMVEDGDVNFQQQLSGLKQNMQIEQNTVPRTQGWEELCIEDGGIASQLYKEIYDVWKDGFQEFPPELLNRLKYQDGYIYKTVCNGLSLDGLPLREFSRIKIVPPTLYVIGEKNNDTSIPVGITSFKGVGDEPYITVSGNYRTNGTIEPFKDVKVGVATNGEVFRTGGLEGDDEMYSGVYSDEVMGTFGIESPFEVIRDGETGATFTLVLKDKYKKGIDSK